MLQNRHKVLRTFSASVLRTVQIADHCKLVDALTTGDHRAASEYAFRYSQCEREMQERADSEGKPLHVWLALHGIRS